MDAEMEFRQVGFTWLHARHESSQHGVVLTVTNERTRHLESAVLTTAMARQLRDWLNGHFPPDHQSHYVTIWMFWRAVGWEATYLAYMRTLAMMPPHDWEMWVRAGRIPPGPNFDPGTEV